MGRTASKSLRSSKTDAHGTRHWCLFWVRGSSVSSCESYCREILLLHWVSKTTSCCLSFCFDFIKHYRIGASCSFSLTHTSIRCVNAIYASRFLFFGVLKSSPAMCFLRKVLLQECLGFLICLEDCVFLALQRGQWVLNLLTFLAGLQMCWVGNVPLFESAGRQRTVHKWYLCVGTYSYQKMEHSDTEVK